MSESRASELRFPSSLCARLEWDWQAARPLCKQPLNCYTSGFVGLRFVQGQAGQNRSLTPLHGRRALRVLHSWAAAKLLLSVLAGCPGCWWPCGMLTQAHPPAASAARQCLRAGLAVSRQQAAATCWPQNFQMSR